MDQSTEGQEGVTSLIMGDLIVLSDRKSPLGFQIYPSRDHAGLHRLPDRSNREFHTSDAAEALRRAIHGLSQRCKRALVRTGLEDKRADRQELLTKGAQGS